MQNIPTIGEMNRQWEEQRRQERKSRQHTSLPKHRLQKEINNLHLVDRQGNSRALITLKCTVCKTIHPDTPAALIWLKLQKDKGTLKCRCGSKDFVRTDSQKPQGELMAEIIDNKTKILKQHVEDEI